MSLIPVGATDQILHFYAELDDGTIKTDLVAADIDKLEIERAGLTSITVYDSSGPTGSVTDKTNPDDPHSDGAIHNQGSVGEYSVDAPYTAFATACTTVKVTGTWTDGGDSGYLIGHAVQVGAKADLVDSPNTTAVAAIAAAVWEIATSTLTTAGSIGKLIVDTLASLVGLSGANTVTITVDDGTNPLEDAKVRVTKGAQSQLLATDANGEVEFTLDDGTWDIAITLIGYTFTATTLVVDGNETPTYSMTANSPTPPDSPFVNAVLQCYETDSTPKANAEVIVTVQSLPATGGYAVQSGPFTITADGDGLIDDFQVIPGARYGLKYDDSSEVHNVAIPSDATNGYQLKPIFG